MTYCLICRSSKMCILLYVMLMTKFCKSKHRDQHVKESIIGPILSESY